MNIFAITPDPIECAELLDNRRVNKMITESMQMLSMALDINGAPSSAFAVNKSGNPYKSNKAHLKHPCTLWAAKSRENFLWLCMHTEALCDEFKLRYGHEQHGRSNLPRMYEAAHYIPEGELTPFAKCVDDDLKSITNVHTAYSQYMLRKWSKEDQAFLLSRINVLGRKT